MKYLTFNNIIRSEIKLKDTEGHFSHIWTKFFDHYLILKKVFYSTARSVQREPPQTSA